MQQAQVRPPVPYADHEFDKYKVLAEVMTFDIDSLPRRLSHAEASNATRVLRRLFVQPDAFAPAFGPAATARAITAMGADYPRGEDYPAISAGAALFDERWCYMSMIGAHPFRLANDAVLELTWALPLGRDALMELTMSDPSWHGMNPHVLYSAQGRWAVSISEEAHAIVAGPREFVTTVLGRLDVSEDVFSFIEEWTHGVSRDIDISWLPNLLESVYGPGAAAMIPATGGATP